MANNKELILEFLDKYGIEYKLLEHETITTMEQGKEIMSKLTGEIPINLFLRDKNDKYYLFIKKMGSQIKITDIGKKLGVKDLKMASADKLQELLGVPQGCASILALINDMKHSVEVLIDVSLEGSEYINFHPLRNNATATISYPNMFKFIETTGHKFIFV